MHNRKNGLKILLAPLGLLRALAVVCLVLACADGYAGVLASFPFSSDTNPATVAAPLQSATFGASSLSNQYIGDDGFGSVLEAYPASGATDTSTALAQPSYFTITATAAPGQPFNLSQLQFEVGKGGDADPRGYFVRSSVDGYASNLNAQVLPSGTNQAPALVTINLASISGMQHLNGITFRFYIYTPDYQANSVDFRNLTLSGMASSAQAVPVNRYTWLLLLLVGGCGGVLLFRRKETDIRCLRT
jgi:hypothetical protein